MLPITERTQPQPRPQDPSPRERGPVVVLGHTGLLGQALVRVAAERGLRTLGIASRTVPGLNLARQADLAPFLDPLAPSLVVNAAAITDLAACEADPSAAHEVHVRLPGLLADWSRHSGVPWVQVSTDHYWNDIENALHDEAAPVGPPNVYARSKHAGEELALRDPGCLVLRTNIVGFRGRTGAPTFAEWAVNALAAGEPFDAYTDVWASSIEVHQFSQALFDLVAGGARGLLNVASHDSLSKADFIAALARAAGYDPQLARRVGRPARQRPRRANAMGLDVTRAEALLGRALPGADEVIAAIVASPAMPKLTLRLDLALEPLELRPAEATAAVAAVDAGAAGGNET
ncbi:MAG: sugar nucleotide-binding protein [Rubrivivax sp.]|nr:sugar nucleotide-binding protein [Rubrivivax sp.]